MRDVTVLSLDPSPTGGASPAARAHAWLVDACFPFWAERAVHPSGGFRERLGLDGAPLDDEVSRVRVQARQTYLFARAALMGWRPAAARALVQHGVESLLGPCRRDDELFGRLVRPGVDLADPQPDLYDNAFGVLALAWAARALDAPELVEEADAVLARLDAVLGHPAGGYAESDPPRAPRRQNPHMHLFEACLALYETSGRGEHAARAEKLAALFEDRFLDPASGCVREFLDDDLRPIGGADSDIMNPGHGLEWVALMAVYARATGSARPEGAARIYDAALASLDGHGFAPMSARRAGAPIDASRRTWSQAETLRAHLAQAGDDPAAPQRARDLLDALFTAHLDPAPFGGWIDHYDVDGRACVDSITAATGYHLVTAFADVIESPFMQADSAAAELAAQPLSRAAP